MTREPAEVGAGVGLNDEVVPEYRMGVDCGHHPQRVLRFLQDVPDQRNAPGRRRLVPIFGNGDVAVPVFLQGPLEVEARRQVARKQPGQPALEQADLLIDVEIGHHEMKRAIEQQNVVAGCPGIAKTLVRSETVAGTKIGEIDIALEYFSLQFAYSQRIPRRKIKT